MWYRAYEGGIQGECQNVDEECINFKEADTSIDIDASGVRQAEKQRRKGSS